MFLLPQIPKFLAEDLAASRGRMSVAEARAARSLDHPLKVFSPTGGSHVPENLLERLRDSLEDVAREHGYPKVRPTDLAGFDKEAAVRLHRTLKITANEASKPGPWQFLACVVMPDLVVWRQRRSDDAQVNRDNFLDSTNNLFRRLWWRAHIFSDPNQVVDPLWLMDELLEDAIQTFYERRSLSGTPRMGVVFGRVYWATAKVLPTRFNMEPVERTAQKWLVRIGENVAYDYLDDDALFGIVADAFHRSVPAAFADIAAEDILTGIAKPAVTKPAPQSAPPASISVPATPVVPTSNAVEFDTALKLAFSAERGAYSIVTMREADASEINLTGPEAKIAEEFFGRERIHAGPVRSNPEAARQRFRFYASGEIIFLNLVYPKHDKTEMRLYLSTQKGFKPAGGAIWFLFQRKRDLFIGFMSSEEWQRHVSNPSARANSSN